MDITSKSVPIYVFLVILICDVILYTKCMKIPMKISPPNGCLPKWNVVHI